MQKPLRIAIPIHSLEPGGVERVALGLATQWRDAGHDVTIVLGRAGASGQDGSGLCSAPALDYWSLPTRLSTASWRTPWMVHTLYSFLVENRVDVLFCAGNTYAVIGAAMKLLLGNHAPAMLLKISNALERPDMAPLLRRGYGTWLRAQGRTFDGIVALSEPMRREARDYMLADAGQVQVIANPILPRRRLTQLARIRQAAPSVWGMRYLAAGRLVPQKNFSLMLHAFAAASRAEDRLTIAGDGAERGRLQALCAQLGIADRVVFTGHVAAIDPLLEDADAMLLSSDYEGLPGVVVEAMAAGLPVLATDCCVSMASLVEHERTGLLVPRRDAEAFADGIVRLRDMRGDPDRARAIAARYELEGAAARYIDLMRDVVRRREQDLRHELAISALAPCRSLRRSQ